MLYLFLLRKYGRIFKWFHDQVLLNQIKSKLNKLNCNKKKIEYNLMLLIIR